MPAPQIDSDDYYKVLGLERSATEAQIKKAFRKLAIKYHPDKAKGDKVKAEANFKKISEAYGVLSDPEKKKTFDQFGKGGFEGGIPFSDPGELFSKIFQGQQGQEFASMFGGNFAQFSGMAGDPMGRHGGAANPFGGQDPFASFFGNPGGGGNFGGLNFGAGGGAQNGMDFDLGSIFQNMGVPSKQPTPDFDCYKNGTKVVIQNLRNAPELNWQTGTVQSFDRTRGRHIVQLRSGTKRSLNADNLLQMVTVQFVGLTSRPDLNQQSGKLMQFDPIKGKCTVYIGSKPILVPVHNILFPPKTILKIVGLKSKYQYNGRRGTVVDSDVARRRYTIQLSANEKLSIKFENVNP